MSETSEVSKHCVNCGVLKPLTQFSRHPDTKDRRHCWCKKCSRLSAQRSEAASRQNDPKRAWAKQALRGAKSRAPCSLSVEDILAVAGDVCPIFGVSLRYPTPEDVFTPHTTYPNSPSLDRIIPELNYTVGNIAVISHRGNTIKNNATLAELRQVADWLDQQLHLSADTRSK